MVQLKARDEQQREAPKEEVAEEDAEEGQSHCQSGRAHRSHELSQRLIYERTDLYLFKRMVRYGDQIGGGGGGGGDICLPGENT